MNQWQNEFKSAIKNKLDLETYLDQKIADTKYPLFLPIPFLEKIKKAGPNSPLWLQFIPNDLENNGEGLIDPIGDQTYLVTKNLIHRYLNRALFIPTSNCPISCRYCFRKNELGENNIFKSDLSETLAYLKAHPEIEEIIFTGGDPLILSDDKIKFFTDAIKTISSVKFLRFHTRTPIIIPSRIDDSFIELLNEIKKDFTQVTLMIHVNHADELDNEVIERFFKLKAANILLFSQTVLLKGINNNHQDLKKLFLKLGSIGIIPYYLHHPDQAQGTSHFELSLEEGRHIYAKLRHLLPGWMIPQYIIDIPGGEGKVSAFNPEKFEYDGRLININSELIQVSNKSK